LRLTCELTAGFTYYAACNLKFKTSWKERRRQRQFEATEIILSTSIDCLRFPVVDRDIPAVDTMRAILEMIMESIDDHKPVYVHCWGGVGRNGTAIGCFLMKHGRAHQGSVREAIADLRRNWARAYHGRRAAEEPTFGIFGNTDLSK